MRKPRFTDFILGLLTEPRDVAAAQFSAPGTITVVVHGIGWGHHDSWTNSFARHWRIGPVEEINFNQGVWPWESFYNFFAVSHEWAQCIHTALRTIIARHTGARINIIAHSWGSLVSYLSLQGGDVYHLDERYEIPPLDSETLGDSTIGNYLTHRLG
ncbi:hypothetical protein KAU45_01580 [bacterium]|nr:hypothetical protein [bacterium]